MTAYTLVAAKPKMKKADPASRISCRNSVTPAGLRAMTCQNITRALFAERLRGLGPGMTAPLKDAKGIEGGWDFTLRWSQLQGIAGPGRGGDGVPQPVPNASDPSGGYTVFEAIEKQLGLKLEMQKRAMQVVVIDHLEQKPTEN